jgi:hypothetical protein
MYHTDLSVSFQDTDVCIMVLLDILSGLLYTYLHLPFGADDVSGKSWQFVTAIHMMEEVIV